MADVQSNIKVSIDTTDALASIKNLQRQISAFHTSMAKGGAAANAVTAQMQQTLINSVNATGKFSAQMKTIKTTTESFTSSLEKNKFTLGEYFRYAGGASKTFGKLFKTEFDTINKVARENVKDLQTQYIKMGRDANGAMKAIAVRPLSLDMSDLATKTMIASEKQALLNQLLKQGSTNLLNFGKNTQWAGRQLMVGFTIPLIALGSAASKTFMDMETQAIRFKKVYGDLFTSTTESTAALDAIKNLGKEFTKYGIAVSDTVGLASEAAAAGFKGLDLQRQTAAATKLSILGQVESQKALETTIALQNAFSMSSEDLATNIDFLNAVENQTVLSLDDMSTAIPKAAPVIQQLGGDVKDLAFFMTAMKEGGINASEGANALKSGLASMINPTGKASAMLAGFGINIKKIVVDNKGDLKKTVIDFATALNQLDPLNRAQAIEQMFGKFQFARLSTLFANVTKDGTQAARVLDLAGASIQELAALSEKELGMTSESAMNKFKASVENLKLALVPVGEQFLKVITPIAEFITKILEKFNNLGDGTKKIIVVLTTIVAGLGPVLLMTFGLLMNGLANIIKGFTFMKSLFNKTGQATGTLGTEVKYMTLEQRNAAAVAASLDQVHRDLAQTFTAEAASVDRLTRAYQRSIIAQGAFVPTGVPMARGPIAKRATGKPSVVGGIGNQDTELALLTPGETVIPKDMSKKYGGLINGMIADNIPGYSLGKKSVTFNGQEFNIPTSSRTSQEGLDRIFSKFSKDVEGVTRVLRNLEAQANQTGDEFEALNTTKLKDILDQENVARNKPKGVASTSYDGENYVFAHAKKQNAEITDPLRIRELAGATNSQKLARDLYAAADKGGKVQQLSSFGFMMPERANKKTAGGNFEMARDEMAALFTGDKATRTLSPVYKAWAESNGLTLEKVLKDPALTQKMHSSVLGFGSLISEELKKLPENFGEEQFYKAVADATARIKKADLELTKAVKDMQSTSMLAVDNAQSGKVLERNVVGLKDTGLRQKIGLAPTFENYKSEGNRAFLEAGDELAYSAGVSNAKAYNDGVRSQASDKTDAYMVNRSKKRSAHQQAIKDGKDDANGYIDSKERTMRKRARRRASSAGGTVGPDGQIIPFGTKLPGKRTRRSASRQEGTVGPGGIIIPTGSLLQQEAERMRQVEQYMASEEVMLGPRKPTKYDKTFGKIAGKYRASKIGRVPSSGMGMGLSTAAMMGSSIVPGKAGDVVQKVSMIAFSLSALQPAITSLVAKFGLAAVSIGAAVATAVLSIGVGLYMFNKSANEAGRMIVESAKREAEARVGSSRAIQQFAKTFNKSLPSQREFSRSNNQAIKGSGTQVDQFAKDYATEGNISAQIINQAALKGTSSGINAIALDVANKAAILGLSPEDIAANIKAASNLIGADQVKVQLAVQKLLSPNGKDILKEPLTIQARMEFLEKQSAPAIQAIGKQINELSNIDYGSRYGIGAPKYDYASLKKDAEKQKSINESYAAGGFKGTTMGILKEAGLGVEAVLGINGEDIFSSMRTTVVEDFTAIEQKIQSSSTLLSISFMQQTEALALLNSQYADGLIDKELYDEKLKVSQGNFASLTKSSVSLVKQLKNIDPSGELAAAAVKDLGDQALATLKKSNPALFDKITKSFEGISNASQIQIYMDYASGSLTITDLALLPGIIKQIDGKSATVALKIIQESELTDSAKAGQQIPYQEKLLDDAKKAVTDLKAFPAADKAIQAARLYTAEYRVKYYEGILKDLYKRKNNTGVDQSGQLDTDFNKYKDIKDGTEDAKSATEKYLEILQKEIDALKAKRDAQKDANDEVQRELDLKMKLQDLANQAVEAKISGNYLKAAMLTQESQNIKMKYNQETELRKKDAEIARLEARYKAIQDGAKLTPAETAKIPKKAAGGAIRGAGTGTSDSIPAYLSNGEYVIRAASVNKYGTETFDALNAGRFAIGGIAGVQPGGSTGVHPGGSIGVIGGNAKTTKQRKTVLETPYDSAKRLYQESNKKVVKIPVPPIRANFATNSYKLNKEQREELKSVAQQLLKYNFQSMVVQGHADSRGGVDNDLLSLNRAKATAAYLAKLVPGTSFIPVGHGIYKPLVPNTSAENMALNRRAELFLPDKYKTIYPDFNPKKHTAIMTGLGRIVDSPSVMSRGVLGHSMGGLIQKFANGGLTNYKLPSYEVGSSYIPQDQIAQLHKGERVLTAQENKNFSASGPITNNITINGADKNAKQIAREVMVELERAQKKNNRTNMVRL